MKYLMKIKCSFFQLVMILGLLTGNMSYASTCDVGELPAFEKVYVGPREILCTPHGTFHVTACGTMERVRAVRSDWYGTYILKFKQECPVCGRLYDGYSAEDGYDCPLSKTEVIPHLWCD